MHQENEISQITLRTR